MNDFMASLETQISFANSDIDIIKPFGPAILKTKVSNETLKSFQDKFASLDYNGKLLPTFPVLGDPNWVEDTKNSVVKSYDLYKWFHSQADVKTEITSIVSSYLVALYNEPVEARDYKRKSVTVYSIWANRQLANTWQPRHIHAKGISFIVYAHKPKINDFPHAGDIQFFYGENNEYNENLYFISPEEGDMLVFPSWLQHQVIPYHSENLRVSIAGNAEILTK